MDKKHLIITSVTLGIIAAASGALIGVTNLITKGPIEESKNERINKGIHEIFGGESKIKEGSDIQQSQFAGEYQYLTYVYTVADNSDTVLGYAFMASGSNNFGKISLLAGFTTTAIYKSVYMITDEQTFASTLEDEYIAYINQGDYESVDVHCGATYGATLVKAMIDEAKKAVTGS